MALCPGLPGWAGTREVKPIWILLKQETVSGSGHMQVCTLLQTTAPSPHHSVYTSRMPFLPPSKQRQSTEGTEIKRVDIYNQCQFNLVARTVLMSCSTVDYQLLTQLVKNVLKFLLFVHLFVCFNSNFWSTWTLTSIVCLCMGHF